jgi:ATP-dependent metalloprotease
MFILRFVSATLANQYQDLKQATNIAYTMVTRLGMSSSLGNVDLASNQDRLSGSTRNLIDAEVRRLIEEGRVRAYKLLESKRKELDFLAKALVNYETLSKEEAFKVITGEKLPGRLIMSSGSIKIPNIGQTPLNGEIAGVPQIPGSTPDDESGGKTPPSAVA